MTTVFFTFINFKILLLLLLFILVSENGWYCKFKKTTTASNGGRISLYNASNPANSLDPFCSCDESFSWAHCMYQLFWELSRAPGLPTCYLPFNIISIGSFHIIIIFLHVQLPANSLANQLYYHIYNLSIVSILISKSSQGYG